MAGAAAGQAIPVKGRFAPSPTGRMHLGNLLGAFLSYLSAKNQGGKWLLRIEDIDRGRCRREWAEHIIDDLLFLGLEWDEGPGVNQGTDCGPYFQSERSDIYKRYLTILQEKGLAYPCWCTRAEIMASSAPHESDGRIVYSGLCRDNEKRAREMAGKPSATRIKVPGRDITFTDRHFGAQKVNLAGECGDFVLQRSDGSWAYQMAVVVDDALMGVTEVVRGRDLLLSTAQQLFLFEALGFGAGPEYAHFPLLLGSGGQRLSKRDKGLDIGALRAHMNAAEIVGNLAFIAGLVPKAEPCTPADLVPLFDWNKIPLQDIAMPSCGMFLQEG